MSICVSLFWADSGVLMLLKLARSMLCNVFKVSSSMFRDDMASFRDISRVCMDVPVLTP